MAAQDLRPRFYEGQYLAADDMDAVVAYTQLQLARHELGAHSWGIVAGLTLLERPTSGAPQRRDVLMTPGLAVDGFGRSLIAPAQVRLPESLFANIPYDASVDDPANTGGTPPGRFVRVWLDYSETGTRSPAPGFERCDSGDEFARVQESYRFVIGDQPALVQRRSQIVVGGATFDAAQVLRQYEPTAPALADASIPYQQFPLGDPRAHWLVPIGWVRWVANPQGGGYLVNRNIIPTDLGDDRNRKVRQYAGLSTENLQALDGALVLRNRLADPMAPGSFQARLQSATAIADTLRDIVWVEGNLRVVGDERLAGGALRFADRNGMDLGTPLSIERLGDAGATPEHRSLDVLIGPDAQPTNRFAVATVTKDDPDPAKRTLSEKLTVLSNGLVGIGNDTPTQSLHVKGDGIRLESKDGARIADLRVDGAQVALETTTSDLAIRTIGGAPPHHLLLNPDATNGRVGIGTATPLHKLDVKAQSIKLGLEDNGGGQLILRNNAGDNRVWLEGFSTDGNSSASDVLITGRLGAPLPMHSVLATTAFFSGNVGIGTNVPADRLHVAGPFMRVDGVLAEGASVGSEGHGSVVLGTRSSSVHIADMRNLTVGFNTTDPAAWLTVWCLDTHEVSDERAKTNVRPIEGALDKVTQLRGVRYEWKTSAAHLRTPEGRLGLIAQEVQKVVPQAVSINERGAGISYSSLIPLLIESVKELKAETEALRDEIEKLKKSRKKTKKE
jgi:hypothetical protein